MKKIEKAIVIVSDSARLLVWDHSILSFLSFHSKAIALNKMKKLISTYSMLGNMGILQTI